MRSRSGSRLLVVLVAGLLAVAAAVVVGARPADAGTASPATVAFGDVPLEVPRSQDIAITPDADYQVQDAAVDAAARFRFDVDRGSCATAAAGTTCTLTLTVTAIGTGELSTLLDVIACRADHLCERIDVRITARGVSVAHADPVSVDFGELPLETPTTRDIRVTPDANYQVHDASSSPNGRFTVTSDLSACQAAAPGSACTVRLTVTARGVGQLDNLLDVLACRADQLCERIDVPITARGVSVARGMPNPVDFGAIALDVPVTRNVQVTPDATYRVHDAVVFGSGPFGEDVDASACQAAAAGATCTLALTVTASDDGALQGGLLDLTACRDDHLCERIDVPITAIGAAALRAEPATVDFGNVPLDTTVSRDIQVMPDANRIVRTVAGALSPFAADVGSCASTAAGRPCTVHVSATPATIGPMSGALTLGECRVDGTGCRTIEVGLSGHGGVAASITSPSTATFVAGTPGTFTVQAGGSPLPALSVSGDLPDGVTFTDNGDGTATLAGSPATAGSYPITLTASNGVEPAAVQRFTLLVAAASVPLPGTRPSTDDVLHGVPATTHPGQRIHVSGSGFLPGTTVRFGLYSAPVSLGTATVGADGHVAATLTVPDRPGRHTVVAAGVDPGGQARYLGADTRVIRPVPSGSSGSSRAGHASNGGAPAVPAVPAMASPAAGSNGGSLAYTGPLVSLTACGGLAALLVIGGLVLLLTGRRRARR